MSEVTSNMVIGDLSLRDVVADDAEAIITLRNIPSRSQYLHTVSEDIVAQENWIQRDAMNPATRYFAVVRGREIEGFIGLANISMDRLDAEWGRWIMQPLSRSAVGSVLLLYSLAFDEYGLNRLYCRTILENHKVVSFHDSCGLTRSALLENYFEINDVKYTAIEHSIERSEWPELKGKLTKLALWSERT